MRLPGVFAKARCLGQKLLLLLGGSDWANRANWGGVGCGCLVVFCLGGGDLVLTDFVCTLLLSTFVILIILYPFQKIYEFERPFYEYCC